MGQKKVYFGKIACMLAARAAAFELSNPEEEEVEMGLISCSSLISSPFHGQSQKYEEASSK